MRCDLHNCDCLEFLKTVEDNSIDSMVTDPPAGIYFMSKSWDGDKGGRDQWIAWLQEIMVECLRVLKPGGHAFVWALPRTSHWTAMALENAGFTIRDSCHHLFSTGFPKSLDVGKAIDQVERGALVRAKLLYFADKRHIDGKWLESKGIASAASFVDWTTGGHVPSQKNWEIIRTALEITPAEESRFEREVIGTRADGCGNTENSIHKHDGFAASRESTYNVTVPATSEAKQWDGWGTSCKPSHEVWWLCRKPLEGTIAQNVLKWGVGGIHVDACRVRVTEQDAKAMERCNTPGSGRWKDRSPFDSGEKFTEKAKSLDCAAGRWPPNCLFSHSKGCELVGYQNEKGYTINRWKDGAKPFGGGAGHEYEGEEIPGGVREVWRCVEGCQVRELDRQSGDCPSGAAAKSRGSTFDPKNDSKPGARPLSRKKPRADDPVSYSGGDSGGASRFFPVFRVPRRCFLCEQEIEKCSANGANKNSSPIVKDNDFATGVVPQKPQQENVAKSVRSKLSANSVKRSLKTMQETSESFAPKTAKLNLIERLDLLVRSAASLCTKCGIDIAQNIAATLQGQDQELPLGLDFITDYRKNILIQNLVPFVEPWAKAGIIPTIQNLMILFGYVEDVIKRSTSRERNAKNLKLGRSLFAYKSKPSRSERDQGCEDLPHKSPGECTDRANGSDGLKSPRAGAGRTGGASNPHPTVKSLELLRWLIRLITPVGGTTLDPFMGSGTTGIAAYQESCGFIGAEIDPDYFKIAEARIKAARKQLRLF